MKIQNGHELALACVEYPELRDQLPEQFFREFTAGAPKLQLHGDDLALCRVVIDGCKVESENTLSIRLKLRALMDESNGEFVQQVQGASAQPGIDWIKGFNSTSIRIHKGNVFSLTDYDTLVDYAGIIEEIEELEGPNAFYSTNHSKTRLYLTGNQAVLQFDLETRLDPQSQQQRFGLINIAMSGVTLLGTGASKTENLCEVISIPPRGRHNSASPAQTTAVAIPPRGKAAPAAAPAVPARGVGQDLVMPQRTTPDRRRTAV